MNEKEIKEEKKSNKGICECCKEYFNKNHERINKTSKHKKVSSRSSTPPGFWNIEF